MQDKNGSRECEWTVEANLNGNVNIVLSRRVMRSSAREKLPAMEDVKNGQVEIELVTAVVRDPEGSSASRQNEAL